MARAVVGVGCAGVLAILVVLAPLGASHVLHPLPALNRSSDGCFVESRGLMLDSVHDVLHHLLQQHFDRNGDGVLDLILVFDTEQDAEPLGLPVLYLVDGDFDGRLDQGYYDREGQRRCQDMEQVGFEIKEGGVVLIS